MQHLGPTNWEPLFAAGRNVEAFASLDRAVKAGDARALYRLAGFLLTGHLVPRDLPRARSVLRAAVQIGHVDAALLEVALTANGSGGPADWAAAKSLLATAAGSDPIAAEQLRLINAMRLDDAGAPHSLPDAESLTEDRRIARFSRLLSPAECAHVAAAAVDLLTPATVFDPHTRRQIAHPVRTSNDAVIGPMRENLVIRAINQRLAAISGTTIDQGEALTVLRYTRGQQYRLHHDTIAGSRNQRVATVLIYLNEGFGGGETVFPAYGLSIRPQLGDAIVFRNTLATGHPDPNTRHAGEPVTHGAKWLATRWVRARPFNVWSGPE